MFSMFSIIGAPYSTGASVTLYNRSSPGKYDSFPDTFDLARIHRVADNL